MVGLAHVQEEVGEAGLAQGGEGLGKEGREGGSGELVVRGSEGGRLDAGRRKPGGGREGGREGGRGELALVLNAHFCILLINLVPPFFPVSSLPPSLPPFSPGRSLHVRGEGGRREGGREGRWGLDLGDPVRLPRRHRQRRR